MAEPETPASTHEPYVPSANENVPEFTVRAVVVGSLFGLLFGASTVYLALRAGLTVSASIPIAVLAISIGRKFLKTSILENNIIQTTGSAGESVAAGVAFTLPAFLFLTAKESASYFNYVTITVIAIVGGILGTLMMIPLRRSLIVQEHGTLPYPEGTACAQVLIAGEKGGSFALTAYLGLGFASVYAILQNLFNVIAARPSVSTAASNAYLPAARVSGDITPEYMGVGYIIGPRIAGILVAGGVLAWLGLIPLLTKLVPADVVAEQLGKINPVVLGQAGWNPVDKTFGDWTKAIYYAYVRQIGAGAVAAAGLITLLKTLPTIISAFTGSISSLGKGSQDGQSRIQRDLSILVVIFGSLILLAIITFLPQIPGDSIFNKFLIGLLVILFGFFFVTVASRIVGLIGSSNSPISGMTIATIMGTALVFISRGWTGYTYEPMALVIGSLVCIAAANAGATSQDLKTGYLVGATPKYQQIALFIGVIVSALIIGFTILYLDSPTAADRAKDVQHMIGGEKLPAPQATLMATLIKGIFTGKLDWQFILVGAFVAITMELCGIKALSFAVGLYLPLSTTLPIFIGGLIRGFSDWLTKRKTGHVVESDLSKGSLFATGLVAGGTILGVLIAMFTVYIDRFNREEPIENSQVVVAANQDAGAPAPEPPEQAQSGQAPKTRTVNPVTQWLEARSFKNWWTTKWDEWQKTSNPNSTAAERAATAKRWFDLMGVAWFALMGLILFVFSRRQ